MATLLLTLRAALKEAGDPLRAPKMQAYMKSAMPFHGVPAPARRSLTRKLFAGRSWPDADAFAAEVRALWKGATFREERYAAVQLTGHRAAKALQGPALLPLYEELIVSGAWWDYVDELAAHRVGPLLLAHPGVVRPAMLSWSRSSDLWKRRTAILCQLRFKAKTDLSCSTPPSSRRSARRSSSCARRSAGRCASTPRPIRRRCAATSRSTAHG